MSNNDYLPLNTHTLLRIIMDVDDEVTNLKLNNDRLCCENEALQNYNKKLLNRITELEKEIEQYKIIEYEEGIKI